LVFIVSIRQLFNLIVSRGSGAVVIVIAW